MEVRPPKGADSDGQIIRGPSGPYFVYDQDRDCFNIEKISTTKKWRIRMDPLTKDHKIGVLRNALVVARMVIEEKGYLDIRLGENAPTVGTVIDRAMKQTDREAS